MAKISAEENANTFREVAKLLRDTAMELDTIAALFETYNLESAKVPNKATAIGAIRSLAKWLNAANLAVVEAKIQGGGVGPNTEGMGPMKGVKLGPRKSSKKGGKGKSTKRGRETEE